MNAAELYKAGRPEEAIKALGDGLRDDPTDVRRRTFLFELLCFMGEYDRAEKQLDVLAQRGKDAEAGALLYRGALHAERTRQAMFSPGGMLPNTVEPRVVSGTLNGKPFTSLVDADPRIGPRLELFAAGQYTWLPLEHISSLKMEAPRRVRDLLWSPVIVRPSEQMRELELGELLMPVTTPGAWRHADPLVKLGRVTEVEELSPGGALAPVGQKIFLVDDDEIPILEFRELVITQPPPAPSES
jgi:type VI secretion system protein ImpE